MGLSGSKSDSGEASAFSLSQPVQAQDALNMLASHESQQHFQESPPTVAVQQQMQCTASPRRRSSRNDSSMMVGDGSATFNDDDPLENAPALAQAEPEPDTCSCGPLSLSTRVEYSALPLGQTQDVFGLVSIQAAPIAEPNGSAEAERQPMDIVCVLDVSGSMQGDKIRQVQVATQFIIGQAHPKDRLSIVSFESRASRVLRLRKMDTNGKNDANIATLRLSAHGGTSIAAGLDMALSLMEQRRQRNNVSAVLLLTDGNDSSTRSRIPDLMRRMTKANCALYTFGFGRDHDARLLSEIAEQAHTPFTFVEDTDKISEAFAGAVGGLTSVVAQQLEIVLKCQVALKTVHTPFPLQRASTHDVTVKIPDMFASERRDILVELAVPADTSSSGHTVLLEASARYLDLRRNTLVQTASVCMEAQRVSEPQPEAEPDEEVNAQRERVQVTQALQDAASASDRGQFGDALRILEKAGTCMKSSKSKSPMTEALQQELADAQNRMQSRSKWEQGGRAECLDAAQMHKMQRCTNMMESSASPFKKSSKSMYCSPTQDAWIMASPSRSSSSR